METFFFAIVAFVAIVSSILVIRCRNPINSALSLILTFFCLATFYVLLDAPFMAAIQVIVYAGAIMVLIVFVIMLLNLRTETSSRYTHAMTVGSIVGVLSLIEIIYFFNRSGLSGTKGTISNWSEHTELIGKSMFTDFLLPFEITSLLLLVAIIGAVILSKKKFNLRGEIIPLPYYLIVSGIMFSIGTVGVLTRRNAIVIFMCIELMLNSVNLTFIAFSRYLQNIDGQLFVFFIMTVAAAEAAVGLALMIAFYKNRESIDVEDINMLKW